MRIRIEQRLARHRHAQHRRRDLCHDIGREPERTGLSAGSPIGSLPSGSRCAARWPCVRNAFTSAMPAATLNSAVVATGAVPVGGTATTAAVTGFSAGTGARTSRRRQLGARCPASRSTMATTW